MKYNATKEQTAERWTHKTLVKAARTSGKEGDNAANTLRVLSLLNRESGDRPRVIDRTNSKKNFRLPLGFAEVVGIVTCEVQEPPTEPPTELATVHDTLKGLHDYIKERPLPSAQIVSGIGAAVQHRQQLIAERQEQEVTITHR